MNTEQKLSQVHVCRISVFSGKNHFSKHNISVFRFWMAMSWYISWNSSVANILCRWQKPRKTWVMETSKQQRNHLYCALTFSLIVKDLSDREDHLRTSLYPNIQNHSTHFKCTYRWSALFVFRIRNMDVFFTNLICILLVAWKKTGFRQ